MSLTLTATEVPVGDFRLDIEAQTPDGRVVIIENQLERTDHGHLGQLLVYASGLEAAAVVWVAPEYRDDHRRTLDWLNERTDTGVDFFGVTVSVVQIGEDSPKAPVFEVVARPNGWQKGVKEGGGAGTGGPGQRANAVNVVRQDFFAEVLSDVVAARPTIRMPGRGSWNWLSFASGPFGSWSISVTNESRLRVEAYIDTGDAAVNKALFDELHAEADNFQQIVGEPVSWERLDDRRASRVAVYRPVHDLTDPTERSELRAWAPAMLIALYDALNERLRVRGRVLRDAARAAGADGQHAPSLPAVSADE